jgi:peptidoglycan/xylan/chitin deacetylase (PgdA/CDA1 family)
MNAFPVADEGDPAKRLTSTITVVAFLIVLFVFSACTEKNTTKTPSAPAPDSNFLKAQEQKKVDSLAALSRKRKKIYLTFDDGPNKGTRNVLEVIRSEQVAASFFVVGQHTLDTRQQKETLEMLKADDSIELCNHSFSHARNKYTSFYESPSGIINDFNQSKNLLGFSNNVARMPGRNAWRIDTIDHTDIMESKAAIDSLHATGYAIMGWDIEWTFDHKTLAPDADTALLLRRIYNMLEANKTKTPGHLVLLAHDQAYQKDEYVEELRYVIRTLKNNPEYQLVLASEYPGCGENKK